MFHIVMGFIMAAGALVSFLFIPGARGAAMWAGFLVLMLHHTIQEKFQELHKRLDVIDREIRINHQITL